VTRTGCRGRPRLPCALVLVALGFGCGDTGRSFVSFPMLAESAQGGPFAAGDFEVTLARAEVGFGPVYFCATRAADAALCPTAVAESRATASVDLLDPDPQRLGTVDATTGMVRSAMFDYGISWLLPAPDPEPSPRAPDGHSARFAGEARSAGLTVPFEVDIDVVPRSAGDAAVPGLRVEFAVIDGPQSLRVRFDPAGWFRAVDFERLAAAAEDGEPVRIERNSQAYEAIVIGMTSAALPELTWSEAAP
jgi:hypothetical protein